MEAIARAGQRYGVNDVAHLGIAQWDDAFPFQGLDQKLRAVGFLRCGPDVEREITHETLAAGSELKNPDRSLAPHQRPEGRACR